MSILTDKKKRNLFIKILLSIALIFIIFFPFVVVDAGERGVLMKFGEVQNKILGEGLHLVIPILNKVQKLSIRVQKQQISAEASSKDLQEVYTDVALNWHIIPKEVNLLYQEIGNEIQVIDKIINPAVEEVLKAVMAKYTAEEIITNRGEVKAGVDELLTKRLVNYHVAVDDISLVHVHFSQRFSDAVEAKQIAEQEAKRAEFIALKAIKEAEAKVNLARGEAEAQRLIKATLTEDILRKQTVEKWDGRLPQILNGGQLKFDVSKYLN
ncbi:prohibitin family protein [Aetokthonos hydrillicola Thurmond2011]|jgi:regulator of protease activity HflC (stomatin/prohibitin superfamily)|uniref:Prohibitin family protein n=1 Tax=Aetokthonos hydrillicola Thurmond2011 TaxID=2712845 RepID=A0AAP5I4N5_9CYAN|nr:prohibitin family protein [Aetokthonos hydrillicola]MBO3460467.1 prohibitin family protein [Aetokthonos hydrillicola CCALA 1050]MBW4588245.1 prohibitin family protein [Aetokthonos hydrillicola CCALA 1050]MDR9893068.1 prohibitin family protein [Aetokthonos hydrillicola Thurmond2011]